MDMLLTLVGLLLVVAGLLVFLFGRSRSHGDDGKNNVFEAFGIKLDVANPSILLIMFGVVMMLTPRFVPFGENRPAGAEADPVAAVMESVREAVLPAADEPVPAPPQIDRAVAEPPAETVESSPPSLPPTAAGPIPAPVTVSAPARAPMPEPSRPLTIPADTVVAMVEPAVVRTTPEPMPTPLKIGVFTEAFNYDGETDGSLRAKMQQSLGGLVADIVGDDGRVDVQNLGFRGSVRRMGLADGTAELCKRTRLDRLLLADLTPASDPFGIESATWPDMRYTLVDCADGSSQQSGWFRMEPVVRDAFPTQQSMLKTARRFIHENRYLLEK